MKFPWWRGAGVAGELNITGRRLDAPAAPLRAELPDGYGDTGFRASGLIFSTSGCWEVTARVGAAELTFVTWVLKPGETLPETATAGGDSHGRAAGNVDPLVPLFDAAAILAIVLLPALAVRRLGQALRVTRVSDLPGGERRPRAG
ncbi:MAG TPA: hypothetical protein VGQ47_04275 [Candidatus Limnocylindrales bacterium]|jgi:hypothetical protein|nr:hypothetical protein [Candidatus Limnocylindrales bacterium]